MSPEMQATVAFYRDMAEHYKRRCLELEARVNRVSENLTYSGRTYKDPTGEQAVRNLSA